VVVVVEVSNSARAGNLVLAAHADPLARTSAETCLILLVDKGSHCSQSALARGQASHDVRLASLVETTCTFDKTLTLNHSSYSLFGPAPPLAPTPPFGIAT